MSNTYKRPTRRVFRRLKHKQQLLRFKVDKVKKRRKYKNPTPGQEIIEGSWSDKFGQKQQNNKSKISKRERIRKLRKQKERMKNYE